MRGMKSSELVLIDTPSSSCHQALPPAGVLPMPTALPHGHGRAYRVHIETFGCQMNEYDTELVRSLLATSGFTFTDDKETADVILLNTCAIRENAHTKVYGHLARLHPLKRRRNLVVGVLGCMAQNLKQDLIGGKSIVDVLVGPDGYRRLPTLITQAIESQEQGLIRKGVSVDLSEYETYDETLPQRDRKSTRLNSSHLVNSYAAL